MKIPRLEQLKAPAKKVEIYLRYLDESGFSLKPEIPYGWQEKSERITINSCQSKRINFLGLMGCKNELNSARHQGIIDSKIVRNFLDKFSEGLTKLTLCSDRPSTNPYK